MMCFSTVSISNRNPGINTLHLLVKNNSTGKGGNWQLRKEKESPFSILKMNCKVNSLPTPSMNTVACTKHAKKSLMMGDHGFVFKDSE